MRSMGRSNKFRLILCLVVGLAIVGLQSNAWFKPAVAQEQVQELGGDETASTVADTQLQDESGKRQTIMAFLNKGGIIAYAILGFLALAIFFLLDQLRIHWLEKVRGKTLFKASLRKLSMDNFQAVVAQCDRSRVGRLLFEVNNAYIKSGDLGLISQEADFFSQKEEQRFSSFDNRMAFFSDTAGGLGLLGTVWGIYNAFTGSKDGGLSTEFVLDHMGLALVTTFVGIVASIIINYMATEMGSATTRRVEASLDRVDDYRSIVLDMGESLLSHKGEGANAGS